MDEKRPLTAKERKPEVGDVLFERAKPTDLYLVELYSDEGKEIHLRRLTYAAFFGRWPYEKWAEVYDFVYQCRNDFGPVTVREGTDRPTAEP